MKRPAKTAPAQPAPAPAPAPAQPAEPTPAWLLNEIDLGVAALLRITDPMIGKTLGPHLGQCVQRLAAHLPPPKD